MSVQVFGSFGKPFVQTPLCLFRLRKALGLSPAAFLLLQVLLDYIEDDPVVRAKKDTLCERTGFDTRAFNRAIAELNDAGLKVFRGSYWLHIVNTYDLTEVVRAALALAEREPTSKPRLPRPVQFSPEVESEEPTPEELASGTWPFPGTTDHSER